MSIPWVWIGVCVVLCIVFLILGLISTLPHERKSNPKRAAFFLGIGLVLIGTFEKHDYMRPSLMVVGAALAVFCWRFQLETRPMCSRCRKRTCICEFPSEPEVIKYGNHKSPPSGVGLIN